MVKKEREFSKKSINFVQRYFFWATIALLVLISFFILKGFIIVLVSTFVLAYLVKPLQRRISKKINKKVSALICLFILILAILIPIFFLILNLITQINASFSINSNLDTTLPLVGKYMPIIKENGLNILLSILKSSISQIPALVISLAITIIATYYIIIDWDKLVNKVEMLAPFKDKKRIRGEVANLTNNIIYGYVFIAIVEFLVGFICFYIAGVKLYLLLPALIAILAFIPGLGPGAVWIPTFLYYLFMHDYYTAIGVLITGLIISLVIETMLLPNIVGDKSKIHPLVFLLGVMGGVPIFGIFGFIIGPLVLVYTIKLFEESLNLN